MTQGNEFFAYGRKIKVERKAGSTRWEAAGHSHGMPRYVLDKIGDDATQEGMQRKLDLWASRQGCRPITAGSEKKQMTLAV